MKKQQISKANTWEWITIHPKNGKSYQRRQRKRVEENTETKSRDKSERLTEWKNKDSLAGLKDQLASSLKYNRNYYDTKGNPIYVPPQYKDIVEEIHHSKNNDSTFTNFITGNETDLEKEKKKRLIGLVKVKDKLYQQELEKKKKFFEQTQNNPITIRRNINSFIGTIHAGRSSVADMLYALSYARKRIESNIDPTIEVTYGGKTQEKTLDEMITRLETAKTNDITKINANTGIEKVEIKDLDAYEDDDFTKQEYQPTPTDHADIVSRVNKHLEKTKAKTLDNIEEDKFKKGLEDMLGYDATEYLDDCAFAVFEKATADRKGLIRKTKLIHRSGKTFFATYWINPATGEKTEGNEKAEVEGVETYEGRHEEFATGDVIKFYDTKKGEWTEGTVKRLELSKKYPAGAAIVSTATDKELAVGLKSAKAIVKVKSGHTETGVRAVVIEKKKAAPVPPVSSDDLKHIIVDGSVASLGGSSDVKMYSTTKGGKLVVKEPRMTAGKLNTGQLEAETLTDAIYRNFGFFAPMSYMSKKDDKTVKAADFVPNLRALGSLTAKEKEKHYKQIQSGFVLDCLLGNWDVVGKDEDNILVGPEGQIMRVDNGGSLFYRARGERKPDSKFSDEITELRSFVDGTNAQTKKIYGGVTEAEIKQQAKQLLTRKSELIDLIKSAKYCAEREQIAAALEKRLTWLDKNIVNVKAEPKVDKGAYPSATTKKFFEGWDTLQVEGNKGIKEHVKERIIKFEKKYDTEYARHAKTHGISVEEYKAKAQAKLEKIVKDSSFFRATDADYLEHILLKDGRFKSQFEVKRSDGSYTPTYRAECENDYFNFPESITKDVENRPIYGYFSNDPNGAINREGKNPPPNYTCNYGRVTVKIKRDVAMRKATITSQDSLSMHDSLPAVFAAKPHFTMFGARDVLSESVKESRFGFTSHYTEAQYHNKLTVDDIEEIIFTTKNYNSESTALEQMNHMIKIARETKIPIRIH